MRRIETIDRAPVDEADVRMQPELLCTFLDLPAPCDECSLRERCRAELLACQQFKLYTLGLSSTRWRNAPRQPTREIFAAVFDDAADGRKPGRPRKEAEAA